MRQMYGSPGADMSSKLARIDPWPEAWRSVAHKRPRRSGSNFQLTWQPHYAETQTNTRQRSVFGSGPPTAGSVDDCWPAPIGSTESSQPFRINTKPTKIVKANMEHCKDIKLHALFGLWSNPPKEIRNSVSRVNVWRLRRHHGIRLKQGSVPFSHYRV